MKYIMFNTSVSLPLFVLFTDAVQHKSIAERLTGAHSGTPAHPVEIGSPVAAGYAEVTKTAGEGRLSGSSASLNIGTTDDAQKWAKVLLK